MDLQQRKAEIFRRSEARIAKKKRNTRIALGCMVPVVALCLVSLPRLLPSEAAPEVSIVDQVENLPERTFPTNPELITTPDSLAPEFAGNTPQSPAAPTTTGATLDLSCKEPPKVLITCAEGDSIQTIPGGYHWQYEEKGKMVAVMADAAHPLDPLYPVVSLTTHCPQVTVFPGALVPRQVIAQCWEVSQIGNYDALAENLTLTSLADGSFQLPLRPGTHVYQITLSWEQGTVSYAFQVTLED